MNDEFDLYGYKFTKEYDNNKKINGQVVFWVKCIDNNQRDYSTTSYESATRLLIQKLEFAES